MNVSSSLASVRTPQDLYGLDMAKQRLLETYSTRRGTNVQYPHTLGGSISVSSCTTVEYSFVSAKVALAPISKVAFNFERSPLFSRRNKSADELVGSSSTKLESSSNPSVRLLFPPVNPMLIDHDRVPRSEVYVSVDNERQK